MIHDYPYTNLHELNLDYIMKLCRETMGLHFEQADKFLKLVNQAGEEVSKVKIFYSETALKDDDGNVISTYLIDAGVDGNNLVFDRGNGEIITLTVPYASKANKDVNNVDLTSYVHGVGVSGNKILITFGDGNTYSFTVPFATKALGDENGKNITTYVAELSTSNDKLIVTDGAGVTLAEITIPYAVKALNDVDGDPIKSTYATLLTTDTTTVILKAKDGSVLSTITVPYAVKALTDTEGNTLLGDYGYHLSTNGNKVTLEAHNGTTLNEITVPFATLSTDATNAISTVTVSGDELVFTTHGGTAYRITSPYSVKAQKDSLNNTITHAYVASVTNDPNTGEIEFYAQDGTLLATLTPTVDEAVHDSYSNLIADYVKEIIVDPQNNYMVVNHGTGDSDTLTINYSTHAYKDTYENVIGNTYIRSLAIVEDAVDHHEYLVAYNGELSELFRIDLNDLSVVTSLDDLDDVNITSPTAGDIIIFDGNEWVNQPALPECVNITIIGANVHDNNAGDQIGLSYNLFKYDGYNTPTACTNAEAIDLIFNKHTKVNVAVSDSYYTDSALNSDSYTILPVPNANQIQAFGITKPYTDNSVRIVHLEVDFNTEYARVKVYGGVTLNEPIPDELDDLSDVSITTPSNGDVLTYDSNSQEWVNQAVPTPTVPSDLDDLSDVSITTPSNGDVLTYDSNSQEWINQAVPPTYVTYSEVSTYDSYTQQTISHQFSTWLGTMGIGSGGVQNWYNNGTLQDIVDHGNALHYHIKIDNLNAGRRQLHSVAEYTKLYNANTQTWLDTATLVGAIDQMLQDPTVFTQIEVALYFVNSTTAIDKLVLTADSTDTTFTFGSFSTVTDIYS